MRYCQANVTSDIPAEASTAAADMPTLQAKSALYNEKDGKDGNNRVRGRRGRSRGRRGNRGGGAGAMDLGNYRMGGKFRGTKRQRGLDTGGSKRLRFVAPDEQGEHQNAYSL